MFGLGLVQPQISVSFPEVSGLTCPLDARGTLKGWGRGRGQWPLVLLAFVTVVDRGLWRSGDVAVSLLSSQAFVCVVWSTMSRGEGVKRDREVGNSS